MPLINLIQEQRIAAKRAEGATRTAFFGFAVTAVTVVGAYGFVLFQTESGQATEAKLRSEQQKVAPIASQIAKLEAEYSTLEPRTKTLEDAQGASDRWLRILTHLKTQTPKTTWLTTLRATAADPSKPTLLTLSGAGAAQEPIAEFILRTQNAADLDNVALKYTQERISGKAHAIDFEVTADVKGTAVETIKDATKKEETKS